MVLLVALYSNVLLGFKSKLRKHGNSIWMNSILDIATFVYLGMMAAIHFVMCTVSLVYTYKNLALGTKTGNQSKEYHGANICFLVAGTSGAIVTFSAVSAIARVWFRWGLWYSLQATDWLKHLLREALSDTRGFALFLDSVPKPIQSMTAVVFSEVSGYVGSTVSMGKSIAVFFQHWFIIIIVHSNFVRQAVVALLLLASSPISQMHGITT
jgi:hypothetical protein